MKPLRIGFDAKRLFHNREGLGSYARTLIADLEHSLVDCQFYLFTPSVVSNDYTKSFIDNPRFIIVKPRTRQNKNLWRASSCTKDMLSNKLDVFVGLSNELPKGIEKLGLKSIVVIHDLFFKTFPTQFSRIDREIYKLKYKNALKSADTVITVSKSTKKDLLANFNLDKSKVKVLYQSVSSVFRSITDSTIQEKSHFLVVGSVNERKNLDLIIDAYVQLNKAGFDLPQVIVVGNGKTYKAKMIKKLKYYDLLKYFDFRVGVNNEELVQLYKTAICLLFPSKYEGFGIPILEALHSKIPVLALNHSSIPEILGKHGIIIEYDKPELLNEAIIKISDQNFRKSLLKNVSEHLKKFDSNTIVFQWRKLLLVSTSLPK